MFIAFQQVQRFGQAAGSGIRITAAILALLLQEVGVLLGIGAGHVPFSGGDAAAMADQAVVDDLLGVCSKLDFAGAEGAGGQTQPQAAFLEQIIVFQTADPAVLADAAQNRPVDDVGVFLYEKLLVGGQAKIAFHRQSLLSMRDFERAEQRPGGRAG